ncbi:MAG: hypothetical protein ACPGVE_03030 [Flavobacteriales bacterium]
MRKERKQNSSLGDLEQATSLKSDLVFSYDAMGNRLSKLEKPRTGTGLSPQSQWKKTVYVRDASGNVMATYKRRYLNSSDTLSNFHIFGSDRLGVQQVDTDNPDAQNPEQSRRLGDKRYELKNHLGNVLVTISDLKRATGSTNNVHYEASMTSYSDYYPFGFAMPGRKSDEDGYMYGFQSQEMDNAIKGSGNSLNYKYRMHDARLGRFFAVDPLAPKYPHNSPYAFSENRVLDAIELEGLEAFFIHGTNSSPDARWVKKRDEFSVAIEFYNNVRTLMQLTPNTHIDADFSWEDLAGSFNNQAIAAEQLADYVMENMLDGEDITLIGHSHGGNVAIQAAKIISGRLSCYKEYKDIKVNIITIATPAYNGKYDNENPRNSSFDNHLHIYNDVDGVQMGVANFVGSKDVAKREYNSPKTTNVKINVDGYYRLEAEKPIFSRSGNIIGSEKTTVEKPIEAHGFDFEHPELIQRYIDNGKLKEIE